MDFESILDAYVPDDVQSALVRMVADEYRLTHSELRRKYDIAEARDLEPHVRRANIESKLVDIAKDFPEQIEVRVGKNQRGNSFRYLVFGDSDLLLTQSYVEDGRNIPRESLSRNKFAGNPHQMLLSPEADAERIRKLSEQDSTFGILTHTPMATDRSQVSHVSVVFVDENYHLVTSVNLVDRVALRAAETVPVEVVVDKAVAKLTKTAMKLGSVSG